jgi:SAM-dependent methyltransferase
MQRTVPDGVDDGTRCPVCGGADFLTWRRAHDDRYGHPGSFELAHCKACGHLMTLPRLRERDLPALYGTYYPRKALSSELIASQARHAMAPFARLRRWWMGVDNQGQYLAKPGQKMLDIGCGSGVSLLEAQALGAQAFGIEADPNVEKLARELGLRIHQGSIEDHPFPDVVFDLIIMNQVIEHIPEPDKALRLVASRLSPGGRVVLVFPNRRSLWCRLSGLRWINWHIPYHLHHFDADTFQRLARRSGLMVIRTRTITPNLWTLLQLRASRTQVLQGQLSPVWQVKAGGAVGGASQRASARQLLRRSLITGVVASFALVNRCVDLVGQGDCLMVELERDGG